MEEEQIAKLVDEIRVLAGKIGECFEFPGLSDSTNYQFQVDFGLAIAVVRLKKCDLADVAQWFAFCLRANLVKIDERVRCLIDALYREAADQFDEEEGETAEC